MHRINLLQLLTDNAARPRAWRIENADAEEATVYLYDVIGSDWYGGVDAGEFARELRAITAGTIHLRVNSPGGDVFAARAMVSAIREHPAKVIAHIDGLAASAASTIVMAADELEMSDGGLLMIHNAWTIALGNKEEMRATADLLEKIDGAIAADYVTRTGAALEQVQAWMNAETWFSAEEAKEHGFIDRIATATAKASNWNLRAYRNAPTPPEPEPDPVALELALHHAQNDRRFTLLERISP